jgi:hypothetical protein
VSLGLSTMRYKLVSSSNSLISALIFVYDIIYKNPTNNNNNDNNTLFTKSNTAYRNIYIQSIQEYIHSGA